MRITEISTDGINLTVTYDQGEGTDSLTIKSNSVPEPRFWEKFNLLKDWFNQAMKAEIPFQAEPIKLTNGVKGMNVTAMVTIPKMAERIKITTPRYFEEAEPAMSAEMYAIVSMLFDETKRFIKGKRAQLDLFRTEEPTEQELREEWIRLMKDNNVEVQFIPGTRPMESEKQAATH